MHSKKKIAKFNSKPRNFILISKMKNVIFLSEKGLKLE